ncbi:hypothetical protein [Curtanaerobium respiraculi]|uniref:hypothetical protein n=1 Tax=Curtanaerobium respiraculi TaxID=2949669 RepID=UPI0024B3B76F|nr:hypothetical protein [Curtanaerobium respiraculi]
MADLEHAEGANVSQGGGTALLDGMVPVVGPADKSASPEDTSIPQEMPADVHSLPSGMATAPVEGGETTQKNAAIDASLPDGTTPVADEEGSVPEPADALGGAEPAEKQTEDRKPLGEKWRALPKKRRTTIIGALAAVLVAVTVGAGLAIHHSMQQSAYDNGIAQIEAGDYAAAQATFASLGRFEDSQERASECQDVVDALAAKDAGDYNEAVGLLEDLSLLREDTARERCLCKAHAADAADDWANVLIYAYAAHSGDYELGFLTDPEKAEARTEPEKMLAAAYAEGDGMLNYIAGYYANGGAVWNGEMDDLFEGNEDEEISSLRADASHGFAYAGAEQRYNKGDYTEAAYQFGRLDGFRDSAERQQQAYEAAYQQADGYYASGEFYKAKKVFETLARRNYKDAAGRAASCVQPIPENGALNTGGGSTSIALVAGTEYGYQYLRAYDEAGNVAATVFVHPGATATIRLEGGTHSFKVASGEEWYGEIDLFGDAGRYRQITFAGSGDTYTLNAGSAYEMTLGGYTGSDGNASSKSLSGGSGSM